MAALMLCLVAAALAASGGRWWQLAMAIRARRGDRDTLPAIILSAVAAAGASAMAGGWIALQLRGPGLTLLLGLSLALAGAGALWPMRERAAARAAQSARGPLTAAILLLAAAIGDAAPFTVFAAAAWSGDPLWAAIGGAGGMIAAALAGTMLPDAAAAPRPVRIARRVVALLLLPAGAWLAVAAMGLV